MDAAASLAPAGTIRPLTFTTLFGLLAATGMRISEALALRLSEDGEPRSKLVAFTENGSNAVGW